MMASLVVVMETWTETAGEVVESRMLEALRNETVKRDTAVEESDTLYVFSVNPSAYVMPINIEEKSMSMIVDSGSSCNILPEATFRKMPGLKLRSCNSRIYAYASRSPLGVMGSCEVRMSMQGGG